MAADDASRPSPIRHAPACHGPALHTVSIRVPDARSARLVREIPDFPKARQSSSRDLMPLMRDPLGWGEVMRSFAQVCERAPARPDRWHRNRGDFIVGPALATWCRGLLCPCASPARLARRRVGLSTTTWSTARPAWRSSTMRSAEALGCCIIDDLLATVARASACADW